MPLRESLAALGLCLPLLASAQAPALPARAATVAGFVPSGWAVEQQHEADLDGDGRGDALLLLRGPGPAGRSPPRMLAVMLARPAGFRLAASNAQLIPQVDLARQEDPRADGEIVVRRGGFDLRLALSASEGSYLSASLRYVFRYQGGCFLLIAFDRLQTHRATLDTEDLSIDFVAGAVQLSRGNAQSDDEAKVHREPLTAHPRRCLQDLGSAATFNPL
jgi:hypothetical protein